MSMDTAYRTVEGREEKLGISAGQELVGLYLWKENQGSVFLFHLDKQLSSWLLSQNPTLGILPNFTRVQNLASGV